MAARGGRAGGGGAARLGPAGALGVGGAGAAAAAGLRAVWWRSSVAGSAASCCTRRRCFLRPPGTGVPLFLFFVPSPPKGFFFSFFPSPLFNIPARCGSPRRFCWATWSRVSTADAGCCQGVCSCKQSRGYPSVLSVCFQTWRVEGV